MLKFPGKIKKFILDILFPIQCLECGKEEEWICENCLEKIKFAEELFCPICKRKSILGRTCFSCREKTALAGLLVACSYENELLKKAIHIFKYRFVKDLSAPLSSFLIQRAEMAFDSEFFPGFWREDNLKEIILAVPVPLHKKRFRWRGFNQSELLAKRVSDFFDLSFRSDILIRSRNTSPQTEIKNRKSRMENIKDAFKCVNPGAVKDKKIILVDDVSTTSSTLSECAKEFSKAGAKEIWGLVLARG